MASEGDEEIAGAQPTETGIDSQATLAGLGAPPLEPAIPATRMLGRYVVVDVLGEGAMGQVVRGYDPRLRREVALKVVRTHGPLASVDAEARLVREAHALARLSHPNVVAVYDAEATDRGVAIAMEYVEGRTLRAWLGEKDRTWREVVEIGIAIAAGVAAAHAAGLVHRDIKPDNVLVGNDGRVRVTDFGLARGFGSSASASGAEANVDADADATLTRTGQVMGTPAYMAPEQHRGAPADALADQYALGILLYEALHGARPFRAANVTMLLELKRAGPPRRPPTAIPSWLHAAVIRGLAPEPEKRWPSVAALQGGLTAGLRRGRRRGVGMAFAGAAALAGVFALLRGVDVRAARTACEEDGNAFGVTAWGETTRAQLHEAIASAHTPEAASTADTLLPLLDERIAELQRTRTEVCLDANVHHRTGWSGETLDRAVWCLEERSEDLSALVSQLRLGDPTAVNKAIDAVATMMPMQPCADTEWLARLPVPTTANREAAQAVRAELSRARAAQWTGEYADGLALARRALARAHELEWPALEATVRLRVADLLQARGAYDDAAAELEATYFAAAKAGVADVAAEAASNLSFLVGAELGRHAEGLEWSRHAEVALTQVSDPLRLREAGRLTNLASIHLRMAGYEEARALYERALAIQEEALGPEHPVIAVALNNLAIDEGEMGAHADAVVHLERALAIEEAALGAAHPDVARTHHNIGATRLLMDEFAEAEAQFEQALAIRRRALGGDHPETASTLTNLGMAHYEASEYAEARELLEASAEIQLRVQPEHTEAAHALLGLGMVQRELGEHEAARVSFERALAIEIAALGEEHIQVAKTLSTLGNLAYITGAIAVAKGYLERSVAIASAIRDDDPHLGFALVTLARIALDEKRAADAVELAERAVAVRERGRASERELAEARFVLARALWETGGSDERALALAEQARVALARYGASPALADIMMWILARGGVIAD